jgi:hypothetical protein
LSPESAPARHPASGQLRNLPAPLALMLRLSFLSFRVALVADDTRETENIHFLAGQVHALVGFCIAVIHNHPSPTELSLHLDAVEHVTLAHVESTLVMEDFLDGVRNVFDRLKTALADAEARHEEHTAPAEGISEKSDWEEAAAAQAIRQRQDHP